MAAKALPEADLKVVPTFVGLASKVLWAAGEGKVKEIITSRHHTPEFMRECLKCAIEYGDSNLVRILTEVVEETRATEC